jgi:hypothetical protein
MIRAMKWLAGPARSPILLKTESERDRIQCGERRAEALRQAQLAIKAKHPLPLYWGAFVCPGGPSAHITS